MLISYIIMAINLLCFSYLIKNFNLNACGLFFLFQSLINTSTVLCFPSYSQDLLRNSKKINYYKHRNLYVRIVSERFIYLLIFSTLIIILTKEILILSVPLGYLFQF